MKPFVHRACPICGADGAAAEVGADRAAERMDAATLRHFWSGLFKEKCFFTYHRCRDCGLLYNPVFLNPADLAKLYASMAPNMDLVADDAIAATQTGYFARVAREASLSGGYLEIGPDVGHIVAEAARQGRFDHYWLFEPNRSVHERLRRAAGKGPVTLLTDMDDLSAVPDHQVDLAVMVHVLDHLIDPLPMLTQLRSKLRPGGKLMIVTHNEQSGLRRLMGRRWPPFCLQHPELYNPGTIEMLLRRAGFAGIVVERSRNVFPLDFLARQAAWSLGLKLQRTGLPAIPVGLRLGNMLTLASAASQAAAREAAPLETAA